MPPHAGLAYRQKKRALPSPEFMKGGIRPGRRCGTAKRREADKTAEGHEQWQDSASLKKTKHRLPESIPETRTLLTARQEALRTDRGNVRNIFAILSGSTLRRCGTTNSSAAYMRKARGNAAACCRQGAPRSRSQCGLQPLCRHTPQTACTRIFSSLAAGRQKQDVPGVHLKRT